MSLHFCVQPCCSSQIKFLTWICHTPAIPVHRYQSLQAHTSHYISTQIPIPSSTHITLYQYTDTNPFKHTHHTISVHRYQSLQANTSHYISTQIPIPSSTHITLYQYTDTNPFKHTHHTISVHRYQSLQAHTSHYISVSVLAFRHTFCYSQFSPTYGIICLLFILNSFI
jgi:hypothetical protein